MRSRPNLWALPTPPRREETRTFGDPGQRGLLITLTLRETTTLELAAIRERAVELTTEYVTGLLDDDGEPVIGTDGKAVKPATVFMCGDGTPVRLSRTICYTLATLEGLQAPEGSADADYLISILLKTPTAFAEIATWATEFMALPGNASRVSDADSSGAPTSPATDTPALISTPTPASGPSMIASGTSAAA